MHKEKKIMYPHNGEWKKRKRKEEIPAQLSSEILKLDFSKAVENETCIRGTVCGRICKIIYRKKAIPIHHSRGTSAEPGIKPECHPTERC